MWDTLGIGNYSCMGALSNEKRRPNSVQGVKLREVPYNG